MVTMTSKCEFDRQNGVLKHYLPRHSFCSQYGFSNSVNDKSHEDADTRTKFTNNLPALSFCMLYKLARVFWSILQSQD